MKNILNIIVSLLLIISSSCTEETPEEEKNLILDHSAISIEVGEDTTIKVVEAPIASETVVWASSDESVASVFYGVVTAISSGTATISATMGQYVAECTITVPERSYQLVWSDEFDGTELNMDNWTIEVNGNGGGNNELQYYTDRSDNIRVEDGMLVIEAKKEEYENKSYTSGRIITKNKQDFKYGKIEARLKVPSGVGTWPALWMLGYGSWPRAGEIDIMEHVGYDPNTFHCALHTLNYNGMASSSGNASGELELDEACANDFHIITMEWIENEFMGYDRIHVYVDGVKMKTFAETSQLQESGDWPFNDQFFFIINLAIGGSWGGAQGIDDAMFDNPVLYKVDYLRVYQLQ